MPSKRLQLTVAMLAWSLLSSACIVAYGIPEMPDEPHLLNPDSTFVIGRGDLLSVKFFYTAELNEDVTVRPDGHISLQLVGEIHVMGKTPGQLSEELRGLYGQVLSKPDVVVIVRHSASHRAYVGGEVSQPRLVELDGSTTIADALFAAGGAKLTGELTSVILVRKTDAGREAYRVDMSDVLRAEAPMPVLQPYDLVYVPKSYIAEVGDFVELYINRIVPKNSSFTAFYSLDPRVR